METLEDIVISDRLLSFTEGEKKVYCDTTDVVVGLVVVGTAVLENTIVVDVEDDYLFLSASAISTTEQLADFKRVSMTELIELQIYWLLVEGIGLDNMGVELFPNEPSLYELGHPFGAILIHYVGSSFSSTGASVSMYEQDRELTFQIYVITRNLRNNRGIQRYMELIRNIISGTIPFYCNKHLSQYDESFIGEYDGEWHYGMFFRTQTRYTLGGVLNG